MSRKPEFSYFDPGDQATLRGADVCHPQATQSAAPHTRQCLLRFSAVTVYDLKAHAWPMTLCNPKIEHFITAHKANAMKENYCINAELMMLLRTWSWVSYKQCLCPKASPWQPWRCWAGLLCPTATWGRMKGLPAAHCWHSANGCWLTGRTWPLSLNRHAHLYFTLVWMSVFWNVSLTFV